MDPIYSIGLFFFVLSVLFIVKEALRLYLAYKADRKIEYTVELQATIAIALSYILTYLIA